MRISEVASIYGISVDTLRYYDKIGLLTPGRKQGVRHYAPANLERLQDIVKMKNLMFSLDEISCLLNLDIEIEEGLHQGTLDSAVVENARLMIQAKHEEVNSLERDLQRVLLYLEGIMKKLDQVIR